MTRPLTNQDSIASSMSSDPRHEKGVVGISWAALSPNFVDWIETSLKPRQVEVVKSVVTGRLFENDSNELLRNVGLQGHAASWNLVARFAPEDPEFISCDEQRLFHLWGIIFHNKVGVFRPEELPGFLKTRRLEIEQVLKLVMFVYHDLLPLIEERNFQSVGKMLLEIIQSYPLPDLQEPNYKANLTEAVQRAMINGACNEEISRDLAKFRIIGMDKERANAAFDTIISELHASRGNLQPTKQELLLNAIRNSPELEFLLEDIEHIFSGSDTDAKRLAQKKLSELDDKLQEFGLHVERIPGYRVAEKK